MKKFVNGSYLDLTAEDIRLQRNEQALEKTRPLTEAELTRAFIRQNIQSIVPDDASASRAVAYHPELLYGGSLIRAGTRIQWKGGLKRAAVDLWDLEGNDPDHAPALWEDLSYKDGYRIIPETITASQAFCEEEWGWWEGRLYRSRVSGNVYTPAVYPANWEAVSCDG